MNNYSPNMLKTFESCPFKYYFKYIQHVSMPQKASIFEKGKKIHALANYYLRGDEISKLETVLNSDERKVWEALKHNEYFKKSYVNSEYNLSCKVGEFWIGGRLDAVVKDDNTFFVLDYKTGQIPKNAEFDYQTMVYLLAASKKFSENIKFVYIDLKNNNNFVIDFNPEMKLEYEKRILNICEKIENIQLPEDIEHCKKCEFCEYKNICI